VRGERSTDGVRSCAAVTSAQRLVREALRRCWLGRLAALRLWYDRGVSLDAFGVKNLRCLADTGLVPIRPITVLVGRNSSGKSTFLRAFPLLRQSVETARNSPILWYHERYVDLGSLKDAANNQLDDPSVTFRFQLRLPKGAYVAIGDPLFDIAVTLAGGEIPHVSAYEIRVEGHEVRWSFDERGRAQSLVVNGTNEVLNFLGAVSLGGRAYLWPTLQPGETSSVSYQAAPEVFQLDTIDYHTRADDVLLRLVAGRLYPLFHGNTSNDTIDQVADGLWAGERSAMRQQLALQSNQRQFQQNVNALDELVFERIVVSVLARLSPFIIEAADQVLAHFVSRVSYLAPLRVSAQRAYRIQNLAVEEVDPDGENLAMFLRSLSPPESESFAAFTRGALGFETTVKATGIHAEILVKGGGSKKFVNLVDVGFGYSEVLPLAAVLWASCIRPTTQQREPAPLVAIEQPELHLHPAHQSKLARMMVEAMQRSRAAGGGSKILVETHSESLINGLGKLVYEDVIKADDIQIALFDQDEETGQTTVRLAGYRDNGALHDWPYGFLSPVAERRSRPAAAE